MEYRIYSDCSFLGVKKFPQRLEKGECIELSDGTAHTVTTLGYEEANNRTSRAHRSPRGRWGGAPRSLLPVHLTAPAHVHTCAGFFMRAYVPAIARPSTSTHDPPYNHAVHPYPVLSPSTSQLHLVQTSYSTFCL